MLSFKFILTLMLASILGAATSQVYGISIEEIAAGPHRSEKNINRNTYRNPIETLKFFEIAPHMTVVEIWPGGGWYSEILAPYLKDRGIFYAAHFSEKQAKPFFTKMRKRFQESVAKNHELYGDIHITGLFPPTNDTTPAPPGSADRVLTFRNVHNWSKGGYDQKMFNIFFDTLKPGGILGVVEHRAKAGTSFKSMIDSGYMTEAYVIELATKAGFALVTKSEINANPKDSKDYPNGVWSLPPTLRGKDKRRSEYIQIGESDRMTLKFVKPKAGTK